MARKEFHYRWEYELRSSPQALWPVVADTNRFNRDAGVPAVVDTVSADAVERLHNSRRRLRLSLLGFNLEWEEDPFEWIRPYRFGVVRRYKSGPVAEMRISAELAEREGGGTRLVYQIWATPRGALGRLVIPSQIGRRAARQFADTFRRYDEMARARTPALADGDGSTLNAGERARLGRTREKLVADGAREALVARLAETVERGDELTLSRLRPYALADCWTEPRREVLELCLRATRAGLLDFSWELLCPLCRGASQASGSLKDVHSNQHCESCNIDFTVNFDRSVELTFRPNAAVRRVEARAFCVGGPLVTPHVVAQQIIPPRSRRTVTPALEEGRHRVRVHNLPGGQLVSASRDGGARAATLGPGGGAWPTEELHVSTRPALTFENASDAEQLFILERTAWNDQAATAAEVTALQLFRDLFAFEALRPGDQINVGQMTILFTDLRGSTQLYREVGDAVAFGAVMSHFDVLKEAIAAEGGAVVKTLGDAVMAAFTRPAQAVRAIMRAQARLAAPTGDARPLRLKAGIHTGPCIAVTLNDRLDYFGSNVNIAARLEPLSTGADCVISAAVREDPRVAAMLEDPAGDLFAEPLHTRLKGFDEEDFELWRVTTRGASKRETTRGGELKTFTLP